MIKKTFLLFFSILLTSTIKADDYQYTYDEYLKNSHLQTVWKVEEKDDKLIISGTEEESDLVTMECTPSYKIEKYSYKAKNKPIEYTLFLKNRTLYLNGNINNKKLKRMYKIKNVPWIQQLCFGLKPFILSKKKSLKFYIVSPRDFSLVKMIVKKEKTETLTIKNQKFRARKVKLTLPGFKGMFWSANLWFDTKSGDFLKYRGNKGPGTYTKTTLLKSKEKL
jgi:hypothetical protein